MPGVAVLAVQLTYTVALFWYLCRLILAAASPRPSTPASDVASPRALGDVGQPADTDETRFDAGVADHRVTTSARRSTNTNETRFFADRPTGPRLPVAVVSPRLVRLAVGTGQRLLAALAVAGFGYHEYYRWWWAWFLRGKYDPPASLGPLYFLANASQSDDWIGYALLAAAACCLLPFVIWPRPWTVLLAAATVLAWNSPRIAYDWVGYAGLAGMFVCLAPVVVWPQRWAALVACFAGLAWLIPGCIDALGHLPG
jgi:hypothetical protein